MRTVIIAEKPNVAEKIASALGGVRLDNGEELSSKHLNDTKYESLVKKARSKGYMESSKGYVITYAYGHLYEMKAPKDYKPDLRWIPDHFPIIPQEIIDLNVKQMYKVKETPSIKKQTQTIRDLLKNADHIINCMDADREGQAIFMIPYIMSGSRAKVSRLWISDQTEQKIQKAFTQLKSNDEFTNLWYAGIGRSIADWLVGMNITGIHASQTSTMVHIGRVQSPTLALIVERDLEILNFNREVFYTVVAEYTDSFTGELDLAHLGLTKISDKYKAQVIKSEIENIKQGKVIEYESKDEIKLAPLLYSLDTLSADAGQYFHYTMDKTLEIAQTLYEKKSLISYPRSDNNYLPSSLSHEIEIIYNNVSNTNEYVNMCSGYKTPSNRYINDAKQSVSSHYAIIPTVKKADLASLTEEERNIYNLIVIRFLCMFADSAVFKKQSLMVEIGEYHFKTNGKSLSQMGWMSLYPYNGKDAVIPIYNVGDFINIKEYSLAERVTSPPKYYTVGTLGAIMANVGRMVEDKEAKEILKEVEGIGTPATRGGIIAKLEKDGYITQSKNTIKSTDKGRNAIACLKRTGVDSLYSPLLTADWESQLKKVEHGQMNHNDFVKNIVNFVSDSTVKIKGLPYVAKSPTQSAKTNNGNTGSANSVVNGQLKKGRVKMGECGFCKTGIIKGNTKCYYCTNCDKKVWINGLEYRGKNTIDEKEAFKLLAKQKIIVNLKAKTGSAYQGCVWVGTDGKLLVDLVKKS